MARMVLLKHVLPTGESHYDWLVERVGEAALSGVATAPGTPSLDDRCLIAFRVHERIDEAGSTTFEAEPMPDHRRLYLTFEGALSQNRGTVKRIAGGMVRSVSALPGALTVRGKWTSGGPGHTAVEYMWAGVERAGRTWSFVRSGPSWPAARKPIVDPRDEPGLGQELSPWTRML